jgi:hypothetical protein
LGMGPTGPLYQIRLHGKGWVFMWEDNGSLVVPRTHKFVSAGNMRPTSRDQVETLSHLHDIGGNVVHVAIIRPSKKKSVRDESLKFVLSAMKRKLNNYQVKMLMEVVQQLGSARIDKAAAAFDEKGKRDKATYWSAMAMKLSKGKYTNGALTLLKSTLKWNAAADFLRYTFLPGEVMSAIFLAAEDDPESILKVKRGQGYDTDISRRVWWGLAQSDPDRTRKILRKLLADGIVHGALKGLIDNKLVDDGVRDYVKRKLAAENLPADQRKAYGYYTDKLGE